MWEKEWSSKQTCIAQAIRPAVSRGIVCPKTRAAGCLCPGHWLSSRLRDVIAQPCRGCAACTCARASEPVWARSPTRAVPGLECRQTHDPVPAQLDRLPGAAWACAVHRGDSETTALHKRRHRRSLLRSQRKLVLRVLSTTRAGTLLKQQIPIRTF
jgi:hypothetical protein